MKKQIRVQKHQQALVLRQCRKLLHFAVAIAVPPELMQRINMQRTFYDNAQALDPKILDGNYFSSTPIEGDDK